MGRFECHNWSFYVIQILLFLLLYRRCIKMTVGIYKITNLINNKSYIGKSINI